MFFTYSTSIFAPSPFSHTSFVILLFCLSSSVSLHCHRMCSIVSFVLQNRQSGSEAPSISFRCVACGPTVTSSQSGYCAFSAFQCHFVFLSFIAFSPSSQLLCRLPVILILVNPLESSGGYFLSFEIDSSRVRLASSSASFTSSFSVILACLLVCSSLYHILTTSRGLSGIAVFTFMRMIYRWFITLVLSRTFHGVFIIWTWICSVIQAESDEESGNSD
jgi:hypothetical protein